MFGIVCRTKKNSTSLWFTRAKAFMKIYVPWKSSYVQHGHGHLIFYVLDYS